MGLSASQGRLLSLTARLSDLERRGQAISNQKMRLANETEAISKNYLDALNAKKLTAYNPDTNTYIDASLATIYKLNDCASNGEKRIIVDSLGNVVCPSSVIASRADYMMDYFRQTGNTYVNGRILNNTDINNASQIAERAKTDNISAFGSEDTYLNFMFDGNVPTDENNELVKYYKNIYSGLEAYAQTLGYTTASTSIMNGEHWQGDVYLQDGETPVFSNNSAVVEKIEKAYNTNTPLNVNDINNTFKYISEFSNNTEWLYQQLSMGNLFIVEYNEEGGAEGSGAWEKISWSTGDAQLVTANDDYALAKAEAEYEAAMNEVATKDKRFDLELKEIDTEHSAIQTEMESVKKVMQKNIDRTFKMFS